MKSIHDNMRKEQAFRGHFALECMSWLRELDFYLMEVSLMKTRLSHLVDVVTNRALIDKAEKFVLRLMEHEYQILLLYNEIKSHESKQINITTPSVVNSDKEEMMKDHAHLRSAMAEMSAAFLELRTVFNKWINEELREF